MTSSTIVASRLSNPSSEASSDAVVASSGALAGLAEALARVTDPRHRRGVRHPFSGMLALVILGLLGRIREMAVLVRWAEAHWDQLAEPLGFTRDKPPVDTTFSRVLAHFSIDEFREAFSHWLREAIEDFDETWVAAVDGKTAKQSIGEDGRPIHMLNVFLQQAKVTLDQWDIGHDKTNEPGSLKQHAAELFEAYPMLRLLTGDAIFAQRPLLEVLRSHGCDYLFQVKANQGDILDALHVCFDRASERPPLDEVTEKRGRARKPAGFGSTWTTPSTSASV